MRGNPSSVKRLQSHTIGDFRNASQRSPCEIVWRDWESLDTLCRCFEVWWQFRLIIAMQFSKAESPPCFMEPKFRKTKCFSRRRLLVRAGSFASVSSRYLRSRVANCHSKFVIIPLKCDFVVVRNRDSELKFFLGPFTALFVRSRKSVFPWKETEIDGNPSRG